MEKKIVFFKNVLNSRGILFFKVNMILLSVYPIKNEPIKTKAIKPISNFLNIRGK